MQLSVTDLASTGFGGTLRHARKYCNQLLQGTQPVSKDYGNGYNWLISNLPHLIDGSDGEGSYIAAVFDSIKAFWFNSSSPYAPRYGAKHDLTYTYDGDIQEHIYTLTAFDGRKWQFYKLDSDNYPAGALIQAFLPGGQTIEATYDETLLTELEQTDGQNTESLQYAYDVLNGADVIASITLVRNGTNLRRVVYAYYESDVEDKGSIGDLKSATRQNYVGGEWVTRDVYFYQYYTDSEGAGFQHGLRYVVGPEAYRRMVAAGKDPETANDVEDYADNYYEYNDGDYPQKVTKETVAGGSRTYTFTYDTQSPTGDFNKWCTKTVETRPDGSTLIVYTNQIGQPLLKHLDDGASEWIEYFKYDTAARLLEHWSPAAVSGYTTDGNGHWVQTSEPYVTPSGEGDEQGDVGLVRCYEYYSSDSGIGEDTAGEAGGYLSFKKIKEGYQGTAVTLAETKYYKHSGGDATYTYPVAQQFAYPDAGNGAIKIETEYSYDWYDDSHQIKERITTPETVTTAKNGSDSSNHRYEYFDEYGNPAWSKDERG
ncbi:MAG: hypothetical protein K8R46_11155, partial [Pirellulales bacterium]|nr:hypothetical protein [Pirellulales bacterium]